LPKYYGGDTLTFSSHRRSFFHSSFVVVFPPTRTPISLYIFRKILQKLKQLPMENSDSKNTDIKNDTPSSSKSSKSSPKRRFPSLTRDGIGAFMTPNPDGTGMVFKRLKMSIKQPDNNNNQAGGSSKRNHDVIQLGDSDDDDDVKIIPTKKEAVDEDAEYGGDDNDDLVRYISGEYEISHQFGAAAFRNTLIIQNTLTKDDPNIELFKAFRKCIDEATAASKEAGLPADRLGVVIDAPKLRDPIFVPVREITEDTLFSIYHAFLKVG
jgi:hypothetical protein